MQTRRRGCSNGRPDWMRPTRRLGKRYGWPRAPDARLTGRRSDSSTALEDKGDVVILLVIAHNTAREAIRNKVLYSILFFAFLLVGISGVFGAASIGDEMKF